VQVHQLGRAAEGPYLVSDLIVGRGLERAAREDVEPMRAAAIVRTLADAVAAVHAQGILHRDLKPANVILREPDHAPVLLDFGVARDQTAERLTTTGVSVGTPNYMSPEQAAGARPDAIDARTDVYGLGAILFELLAGRPPHEADSAFATLRKVISEEPRWPSADRPGVPWALEAVLRMAMDRERMFRYRSAEALRDDLDRVLKGERPQAAGAGLEAEAKHLRPLVGVARSQSLGRVRHEVGDLLLAVSRLSAKLGVPPEDALREATGRFEGRFRGIERTLAERGRTPSESTLEEMDEIWNQVKRNSSGA
jgi:serine/threonine protein kinase